MGSRSSRGRAALCHRRSPARPDQTQRYDLFSLGAIGYWLITGVNAFSARTLDELPQLGSARRLLPRT